MWEPSKRETQLGLADLKKRFTAWGIQIIKNNHYDDRRATYLAIGRPDRHTDIDVTDTFLDDLPNTKDYQKIVDSYAAAVAGRMKCGSPEVFYCLSGVAVRIEFFWPIESAVVGSMLSSWIRSDVTNLCDGQIAKCGVKLGSMYGQTSFDLVRSVVNSIRVQIDGNGISFYKPDFHQELYQQVQPDPYREVKARSKAEIEPFISGKAYVLGFMAAETKGEIWTSDPWDAEYLGVSTKDLLLGMRVLRAQNLLKDGSEPEYMEPTDALLMKMSTPDSKIAGPPQKLSRLNLPTKDALLRAVQDSLNRQEPFAVLMIDLDNFKSVNDTTGHPAGDACLDSVVNTFADVVGRKGKIYRWGSGDEFVVLLPDFSTDEAKATAERIRSSVEHSKPGGDIAVTTSIGVCGTDLAGSKSADEILEFADKAVYASKHSGKNRVTAWPLRANTESTPKTAKPTKKDIRNQLATFLKEARQIQNDLHYNYVDSVRQKQEWEQRVEQYLRENIEESYSVRFQSPGHPAVTYPEGINAKMKAPWADIGARMSMLNSFMAELRD